MFSSTPVGIQIGTETVTGPAIRNGELGVASTSAPTRRPPKPPMKTVAITGTRTLT